MKLRNLALPLLLVALFACLPSSASAALGLRHLDLSFRNADGSVAVEAGAHPDSMTTSVGVTTYVEPGLGQIPEGEARNLRIDFPPGLVGDRGAVPFCTRAEFVDRSEGRAGCSDATAVGYAALKVEFEALPEGSEDEYIHVPVYNLVPSPGVPAELGFVALNVPLTVQVGLSESAPYHLVAKTTNIPQAILFYDSVITVWGNPSHPSHDPLRGKCLSKEVTEFTKEPVSTGKCPVKTPEQAFLTMPRSCTGPLSTLFTLTTWSALQPPVSGTAVTHDDSEPPQPIGMTNCATLGFAPQIGAKPSSSSAQSPTGLTFNLSMEDSGLASPTLKAQSDVKKTVVTLPQGMTVNPSAAAGLSGCTPQQLASESLSGSGGCPESAKLGTVEVNTPLLDETVNGALYQAAPDDPATTTPGAENPFDSLIALYVVIRDPKNGILLNLPGRADPDPVTGQLRATFDELPQIPFSSFTVHFRSGARAPLVTPPRCGTYVVNAQLTPWARPGDSVEPPASFDVNSGIGGGPCPTGSGPFAPGFKAGTVSNSAGSYSEFDLRITRQDGEPAITKLSTVLPPGLVGKLAGVGRCSDAAIEAARSKTGLAELANPSCPADSKVGHVLAGAGVGPELTYVSGSVYLAGPYKGNPLSIAVVTPAVAGPFDVGTVVVRVGLNLDPTTAEVMVDGNSSDPIPRILKGIPLSLRDLRVRLDRPKFTLNATSCDPMQVRATVAGSPAEDFQATTEVLSSLVDRYQAANCSRLRFKPRLSLKLKGGTKRSDHPALRSVVRPRAGNANIARAVVTLPPSQQIDNAHINNPCTRVQFNADACPKASILGRARAFTPLLDQPLEGPVYFRSNGGDRDLPDVVADLNGQFNIVLVGFVDSKNARIRTTFARVPDAPVSKFVLNLFGGKRGLLVNNRNICGRKQRAKLKLVGHNSRLIESAPVVKTDCKKPKRPRR
jgi:hypothetical protein